MWAWLKKAFATSGLCSTEQSSHATLTPPGALSSAFQSNHDRHQQMTDCTQEDASGTSAHHHALGSTPVPLAHLQHQGEACRRRTGTSAADDNAHSSWDVPDRTPPDQAVSTPVQRYIMNGGKPVGIANTLSKYKESQPVMARLTPFEQRVAAKLTEEQKLFPSAAATTADDLR